MQFRKIHYSIGNGSQLKKSNLQTWQTQQHCLHKQLVLSQRILTNLGRLTHTFHALSKSITQTFPQNIFIPKLFFATNNQGSVFEAKLNPICSHILIKQAAYIHIQIPITEWLPTATV